MQFEITTSTDASAAGCPRCSHAPRRDQHVGARARAEVEHGLAVAQVGDRGRHATAERRVHRRLRDVLAPRLVVEAAAEEVLGLRAASARRALPGRGCIALANALADV
jgi:hypothetical protein